MYSTLHRPIFVYHTNLHLSFTNPFKQFPLLVVQAFPPKPTTMAVMMALFPPCLINGEN